MEASSLHTPVLFGELIESLHFFDLGHNVIVDATLGLGGHASGVISKLGRGDVFIGLDCDTENLACATERLRGILAEMPASNQPIVYCIYSNFRDLGEVVKNIANYTPINLKTGLAELTGLTGLYADLGVSSVHFDTPERGFSFRFDGPLDMRLDMTQQKTAATLINSLPYEKMAEIFRIYGDESRAGFIAKKIIEAREISPIETTERLADIVRKAWKDSVPKIFQAFRIAVNDEYASIELLLSSTIELLVPGGSISIIAFHSGEDRIVKHFFRDKSLATIDTVTGQDIAPGVLNVLTKKPITPTDSEIQKNPRSRSALLRVARKNA